VRVCCTGKLRVTEAVAELFSVEEMSRCGSGKVVDGIKGSSAAELCVGGQVRMDWQENAC